MAKDLMWSLAEKAKAAVKKRVVFPESTSENILKAARQALDMGAALPILAGCPQEIEAAAKAAAVSLEGMEIADISRQETIKKYVEYQTRTCGALPPDALRYVLTQPLYYAAMMVRYGDADSMVAGFTHATGEVIMAGQMLIGLEEGIGTPSSIFLMNIPGWQGSEGSQLVFADCAICPEPSPSELADIAISSAGTVRDLLGWEPRVAMLSFSTRGSAEHAKIDLVREATELVRQRAPWLAVDGELQADTAIIPSVAAKKAPDGGQVAGRANILVFPDLNSGNIGYKLVQRLAGADAYGPLLQGFKQTISDLSRGASVEDILGLVVMTVLRAGAAK